MSYAVYKEVDGKKEIVSKENRKGKIESYFNSLKRNFKNSGFFVEEVRTGYFRLPGYSTEYWISKAEETIKEKYIGKWYTYNVCGSKVIVKVTGSVKAGEQFEDDTYIGKKTTIFPNGNSLNEDWACYYKAFESRIQNKEYKEFKF